MAKEVRQLSLFPLGSKEKPLTSTDLERFGRTFKEELLKEIAIMFRDQPKSPPRKWLKNKAVAAMLGVSLRTLQNLRDNGTLPHSRIGRHIYYDPLDIEKEVERRKGRGRHHPEYYNEKLCPPVTHAEKNVRTFKGRRPFSGK